MRRLAWVHVLLVTWHECMGARQVRCHKVQGIVVGSSEERKTKLQCSGRVSIWQVGGKSRDSIPGQEEQGMMYC